MDSFFSGLIYFVIPVMIPPVPRSRSRQGRCARRPYLPGPPPNLPGNEKFLIIFLFGMAWTPTRVGPHLRRLKWSNDN